MSSLRGFSFSLTAAAGAEGRLLLLSFPRQYGLRHRHRHRHYRYYYNNNRSRNGSSSNNSYRRTVAVATSTAAAAAIVAFCSFDRSSPPSRSFNTATTTTTTAAATPRLLATSSHGNGAGPRLVFLGSGSSTGCPRPLCTMLFSSGGSGRKHSRGKKEEEDDGNVDPELRKLRESYCGTSIRAVSANENPIHNRNYRNNPSLLVGTAEGKNVVIDVGKTFREGALRWFPVCGIKSVDAILLTHEHMDAAAGLDDVRGFQRWTAFNRRRLSKQPQRRDASHNDDRGKGEGGGSPTYVGEAVPMPLYASRPCLKALSHQFPWLVPRKYADDEQYNGSERGNNDNGDTATAAAATAAADVPVVKRHVASFDIHVIRNFEPFVVEDIRFVPLPVMHGEDLVSLGYAFTVGEFNVLYLSDISRMLPETLEYIQTQLPPTDVLIVDSLLPNRIHPVHFSMEQAVAMSEQIRPRLITYLVGMSCDSFPPHDEINNELILRYGGKVLFAHDGLVVDLSQ